MYLLPSLGRPQRLQQFIDSYVASEATEIVRVLLASWDSKINEYDKVEMPKTFKRVICHHRFCGPTVNWAVSRWKNEPYYGCLNDDILIRTKHALRDLAIAAGDRYISYADDGHHTHYVTFPVIGGELLRAVGFLVPEGMNHNGGEELWNRLGRDLGAFRPCLEHKLEHMHWAFGKAEKDATYLRNSIASQGSADLFEKFFKANYGKILERTTSLYGEEVENQGS